MKWGKLMVDENNTEVVEPVAPAEIVTTKKRRSAQPKASFSEAAAETSSAEVAKQGSRRNKRTDKPSDVSAVAAPSKAKPKRAANVSRKQRTAAPTTDIKGAVLDGIADLLQLEEENTRLRKTLAEKLRAENADLRKRLGLA